MRSFHNLLFTYHIVGESQNRAGVSSIPAIRPSDHGQFRAGGCGTGPACGRGVVSGGPFCLPPLFKFVGPQSVYRDGI